MVLKFPAKDTYKTNYLDIFILKGFKRGMCSIIRVHSCAYFFLSLQPPRANSKSIKPLSSLDAISRVFASQRENPVGSLERARESDISSVDSFIIGRSRAINLSFRLRLSIYAGRLSHLRVNSHKHVKAYCKLHLGI